MLVYSDYTNQNAHAAGDLLETNVYQEQPINPEDVGTTWEFSFDAKRGDIGGNITAVAFIKTLDPDTGYFITNFIELDTTNLADTWDRFAISLYLITELAGQVLQFGFLSNATNNEPSGNFYDNVAFSQIPNVPGGTVSGINARSAGCVNVTDPQAAFAPLADLALVESWNCGELGLSVTAGDTVRLIVGGSGFTAFFSGQVEALGGGSVFCRNLTQEVDVTTPVADADGLAPAQDCRSHAVTSYGRSWRARQSSLLRPSASSPGLV